MGVLISKYFVGRLDELAESDELDKTKSKDNYLRSIFGSGPYSNLNSKIVMKFSPTQGRGLFAKSLINKGEVIWKNRPDGPMELFYNKYTLGEVRNLSEENRECLTRFATQLDNNTLNGPINYEDVDLDYSNYFNHSCDPNTLPLNTNIWVAIRDIQEGEEVNIDYVTFDLNEYSGIENCSCNSSRCRKSISVDDYKIKELQERYEGFFVEFIQEKINENKVNQN